MLKILSVRAVTNIVNIYFFNQINHKRVKKKTRKLKAN